MAPKPSAIDGIKKCIDERKSFVLQGGAGSGKTESLKETFAYLVGKYPKAKIACITHTNKAVDEIKTRVECGNNIVSTIHSFLAGLIKDYSVNIHSVIHELFLIPEMKREAGDGGSEYKKQEHEKYKKVFKKYKRALRLLKRGSPGKVAGKKDYDSDPENYNRELNAAILMINAEITANISVRDPKSIDYNDTSFDSFEDLTFGHDGLLLVANLLFKKYPRLGKILKDKFDFILVDEYQDTNEKVVDILLRQIAGASNNLTVGFFGDSMQAIYGDGIGDLGSNVASGVLFLINKEDNFRCSYPVVDLLNKLRTDSLEQEVAFKKVNGRMEEAVDRQGSVTFLYGVSESKPHVRSSDEDKEAYFRKLDDMIVSATGGGQFTKLLLTNRAIAEKSGFRGIYDIFSKRYLDPKEYIEKTFDRIQLLELLELLDWFEAKNFNSIFSRLKTLKSAIRSISDKRRVAERFQSLLVANGSIVDALNQAFDAGILKKSEAHTQFVESKDAFLQEQADDIEFQQFKTNYRAGNNTFTKYSKIDNRMDEDTFEEKESDLRTEEFYIELFSANAKFQEARKYSLFAQEKTEYITMHKTKGSSIENVVVVLDEYLWNEYRFGSVFLPGDSDPTVRNKNLKLFYVACSRARKNLKCVRIISSDEEPGLKELFPAAVKVAI